MDINCAPLLVYLLLFCYERDFVLSFSDDIKDALYILKRLSF